MAEIVYERPSYYGYYYSSAFAARVVNTVIGIIEFMLAFRIVLLLLGASSSSQFVAWVYGVTDSLIGPFSGAFANWNIGGMVLDISALFAMIGYVIIAWLLIRLVSFLFASFA